MIARYLEQLQDLLRQLPVGKVEEVVELLFRAHQEGRQVFIFGNGGSAATASHFACDLGKGTIVAGKPRFRVMALTDNVPLLTAWANDTAYENVFAEQLENLVQPGDVVLALSGSGNSPNVLKAVALARAKGAVTVGLCGFQGGRLAGLVDHAIVCPSTTIHHAEDAHHILQHAICVSLRERLAASADIPAP